MQGEDDLRVQQQHQCTALRFVVFTPLPTMLKNASDSADHSAWYTFTCIITMYIYEDFVASQSLLMLVVVTFVPKFSSLLPQGTTNSACVVQTHRPEL